MPQFIIEEPVMVGAHVAPELTSECPGELQDLDDALRERDALRGEIAALRAEHDRRVSELLEANNREVERRRKSEREKNGLALQIDVGRRIATVRERLLKRVIAERNTAETNLARVEMRARDLLSAYHHSRGDQWADALRDALSGPVTDAGSREITTGDLVEIVGTEPWMSDHEGVRYVVCGVQFERNVLGQIDRHRRTAWLIEKPDVGKNSNGGFDGVSVDHLLVLPRAGTQPESQP